MKIILFLGFFAFEIGCAANSNGADSAEYDGVEDTDNSAEPFIPVDFYQQCTDSRCDFVLLEGDKVAGGVATWYEKDTGFRLEGTPVEISVEDEYAAHPAVSVVCYRVRMLGAWDASAQVVLQIEGEYGIFGLTPYESDNPDTVMNDGAEGNYLYRLPLSSSNWHPSEWVFATLAHRGRMSFSIRKEGDGDVVFYYLEVDGENSCDAGSIRIDETKWKI